MRGLKAMLGKDLRLFLRGTGVVCLVLPLLLAAALRLGGGDLVSRAYLEPFPIAIRDEDGTVMSRTLCSQMEKVELFSQVIPAGEESDEALLEQGCAAVVTIPRDLFYTLYDMRENPVRVALNGEMPLEASVFRAVFTSVMEIISADQAAGRAVFRFCYGELTADRQGEMWHETANRLLLDALGRQQVFDSASQGADLRGSVERGFLACALSVLCLFFPLAGVKTLPDEMGSGVLPRFLAAGGSPWAFFLSKLLTAALVTAPAILLLLPVFRPEGWPLVLLEGALLFLGGFGLLLFVAAWAGETAAAVRWGNLILLLSLVLGGAVYPMELMPGWAQALGRFTLPYYARLGLETIHASGDGRLLLARLWPVPAAGLLLGLGAALLLRRSGGSAPASRDGAAAPLPAEGTARPGVWRLLPMAGKKVKAMSGGRLGLIFLLAAALVCGALAGYALERSGPERLTLAAAAEAPDRWAEDLLTRLDAQEGVELLRVSETEGRALLGSGRVEGLLVVGADYGDALAADEDIPLIYTSAAPAASAQAAREIIAGQAAGQRARIRGLADAEARLGRPLTGAEQAALLAEMDREAAEAPPVYEIDTLAGGRDAALDPFVPRPLGFAALAVLLAVLTWGAWAGGADQRRVEGRLASLAGGRALSYISDVLALDAVGLAVGLCALLPGGLTSPWELPALGAYVHCTAALALAAARSTGEGRMDALAPFIALITCLLGGCFGDLGQYSPALRALSLFTPQGLALEAGKGAWPAAVTLLAAGGALLWLGRPPRGERSGI